MDVRYQRGVGEKVPDAGKRNSDIGCETPGMSATFIHDGRCAGRAYFFKKRTPALDLGRPPSGSTRERVEPHVCCHDDADHQEIGWNFSGTARILPIR